MVRYGQQLSQWWVLLIVGVVVVACGSDESVAVPQPLAAVPTLQPTPTLVPALAAVEPSPPPVVGETAGRAEGLPAARAEDTLVPTATTVAVPVDDGVDTAVPTAMSQEEQVETVATPAVVPTTVPTPVPTPILSAAALLALVPTDIEHGDLESAALKLEQVLLTSDTLSDVAVREARYTLGKVYVQDGRFDAAIPHLNQLLNSGGQLSESAHFYLGQAYAGVGNGAAAVAAYERYLVAKPHMGAYVYPLIAELLDEAGAIAAYEMAVNVPAHRLHIIGLRRTLATWYRADANYDAVIAQYDAIRDLAVTENTQGEMTYLAASTALAAGDTETAYARYQEALTAYPRAYETYLGLVALVEAGVAVDDYQRGVIDYYAGAYEPAVVVLERYLATKGETAEPDAWLFLTWSYEGLGDLASALATLEGYQRVRPADAVIERAKLYARAGDVAKAATAYARYLEAFPDGPDAPFAAWWASALLQQLGDMDTAMVRYRELALAYPWHEDAAEALFQAGWLAYWYDDPEMAAISWLQAAQDYPQSRYGMASLLWLQRSAAELQEKAALQAAAWQAEAVLTTTVGVTATVPVTAASSVTATIPSAPTFDWDSFLMTTNQLVSQRGQSITAVPWDYYGFRLYDAVNGVSPFTRSTAFVLPVDETADQAATEAWLRQRLGFEADADVRTLAETLTSDNRFVLGNELWKLGLFEEAKRELESLRASYAANALLSYQLAFYFREIGLYRSSIIAANSAMVQLGVTAFTAPRFLARLAYPVYYNDLVLPLAERYSYDPLLHFSLIRQESLFESFARSGAAAQGLSQVIPATGTYIAQKLAWPNFENDDLYRPDVGLTFGAFYLDEQLAGFEGQVHAALSAYNAGPGNAARWYQTAGGDQDLYVETVDFAETRLYIERIYVGYVVYRYLYGG